MIIGIPYKSKTDGVVKLVKRYSDKGLKIRKVGTDEHFDEAIDVVDAPFVYEETDIPIDNEEDITDNEFISMLKEVL